MSVREVDPWWILWKDGGMGAWDVVECGGDGEWWWGWSGMNPWRLGQPPRPYLPSKRSPQSQPSTSGPQWPRSSIQFCRPHRFLVISIVSWAEHLSSGHKYIGAQDKNTQELRTVFFQVHPELNCWVQDENALELRTKGLSSGHCRFLHILLQKYNLLRFSTFWRSSWILGYLHIREIYTKYF